VDAGKEWVKGKAAGATAKVGGPPENDTRTLAQKQQAVNAAVTDVETAMARPGADRAKVAKALPAIHQRHGLKELKLVDSGAPGQYHAHAALNPEKDSKDAKSEEVTGMVAAYRGIHFQADMDAKDPDAYKRAVATSLVGKPTFSVAALNLAGSRKPDGSDVSDDDKMVAAMYILDQVRQAKSTDPVRQWWGKKQHLFDNMYLGLLQRFINSYDDFKEEANAGKAGGFAASPFISTSKDPAHAAQYAISGKFLPDEKVRKAGIVGRAAVYLFSLKKLAEQDPANVKKLDVEGKINVRARVIDEGEVTFSGSIPGENLVSEHDAPAGISKVELARRMRASAQDKAKAEGGLKSWD
jgi:hypothetical protein